MSGYDTDGTVEEETGRSWWRKVAKIAAAAAMVGSIVTGVAPVSASDHVTPAYNETATVDHVQKLDVNDSDRYLLYSQEGRSRYLTPVASSSSTLESKLVHKEPPSQIQVEPNSQDNNIDVQRRRSVDDNCALPCTAVTTTATTQDGDDGDRPSQSQELEDSDDKECFEQYDDSYNKAAWMPIYSPRATRKMKVIKNISLDTLIDKIYVHYVALDANEFERYYQVFLSVFRQLHAAMKNVNEYYRKYSSTVEITGSHSDRVRIVKPDEFDMDVVIRLPLCTNEHPFNPSNSDYDIKPTSPGHVQLKLGPQGQNLPWRDDWLINRTVFEWLGYDYHLSCLKFSSWFRTVVIKALNKFKADQASLLANFVVNGVEYTVRHKSDSGPAVTLEIANNEQGLLMDFDLVPALSFPETRWPVSEECRIIPEECSASQKVWLVVPKPDKHAECNKELSWRIGMYGQEKKILHNKGHMKQAFRMIKKLRDSLEFKPIASYYIKTIFLWEIEKQQPNFWSNKSPATIFKHMVTLLKEAFENGEILYFWNSEFNLIQHLDKTMLKGYSRKLSRFILALKEKDTVLVTKYLLTGSEFNEIKEKSCALTDEYGAPIFNSGLLVWPDNNKRIKKKILTS